MIVTQGYASQQVLLFGFADFGTHANTTAVVWSKWTLEAIPTCVCSLESVPGRGASQDGAWTEPPTDGAWTEPQWVGAYTADDAFMFEGKPMDTMNNESVPANSFTLRSKPSSTFNNESVPS